ncbi:TPA: hypothetical protein ACH3X2_005084 [Trebouxia sp. C0005]
MALVALKLDDLGKGWRDHGVDSPVIPLINADNSQCLHWCGWNSAVQLLAGFPGVLKYLEWVCDLCPHSLQLHQGLRNQLVQLRELKGTDAVGSVAGLLATVHTAAKDGNLKEMSSRREGGRLIEDVACFELLQMLCGALHNEFMNVFQRAIPDLPEAASYWASMMSTVQHTRQMCHSGRKRCKNIGNRENQQYQAVSVRTAALLHDGGMGQLLCSVLGHYMFVRTECGFCSKGRKKGPAEKSVTEQFVRLPVMLLVSVYSQQTHSAGTDINDAVSLHLQQCVELEEWNSHDWSRHMVSFTLKTIVFREGGITSGHFFVALQCAPDRWQIYNSAAMSGPHTLEQIQQRLGGKVYGVAYMRTDMPADDDRQSLAEWLDDPAHADAVRVLASADVNSGVDLPSAAAAGPSTTSECSPAVSSPDSSLPAMWDLAPSSGPQPLMLPAGPSCPAAAPIKSSFGQSTTQTTTVAHQHKQDTANIAVAAVSSSAVQYDLADLLSRAVTTAQRKQSKKQRSPVSKGNDAGSKLQPTSELSASPSAAAQAARKPRLGQAVDPDQEAAILEKARQLRAERRAEEALIKTTSGSSATAAAPICASQPAVDRKAAKQLAAQQRAERLALKQAESRAKKAAARQQATADAEVAPQGADQLAPVAEAADKSATEAAPTDQGAGRDAVNENAAQPTSDVEMDPASADTVAAHMVLASDDEADREPTAAKGAFEDVPSGTIVAANVTAIRQAAGQVAGDAAAAQEGVAELTDNLTANTAAVDQTAAEAAAAGSTAVEAALDNSLAAEAATADEPAESGQAVAHKPAGNAAADEKEADDALTRAASQNTSAATAVQETADKAAAPESSLSAGAITAAPVLRKAAADPRGGKAAADRAAAQSPAEQANAVQQALADQAAAEGTAMPELIAGQQTAAGVATAGIEVREPVSSGAVAADAVANISADDKVSAANEAAGKGDVQKLFDVAQSVENAAQAAQDAAQAEVSQASGGMTPTKASQDLQAPSTGFGPHKVAAEDEPTSDSGLLFSRWGQDAEAATQAGLLNAKAHTSVDCTVGLPSRDVAAVQAGPLCRADSSDAPVPTQPASAVPLLSDQSETVHGKGHNGLPNSHGGASMVQADLLQGSGMIGEARAVCSDVPGLDRAAGQLPQPNEDRPSSGNAQEQAGVAIGMSRADSSDDSVPAQPASAGPLLPHEVETADGQGHGEAPSGSHVQQQGEPSAAVPTVSQATAQQPTLGHDQGPPPAAPAHVQSRVSPLPLGPVRSTAVSPVHSAAVSLADEQGGGSRSAILLQHSAVGQAHHSLPAPPLAQGQGQLPAALPDEHTEGQLTAAVRAQPVEGQGHPAAAPADSQAKGQVLAMVPVQEPAAHSSCLLDNEALVSYAAKVEAAHPPQPASAVQGGDAAEADGSAATAAPAQAGTAGSNLHRGTAGPMGGVLAQSPALASGRSSTAEAAQSAAAIIDVFGATLHNASGHAAEPHASSAASTVTLPAPAGAQAQGEVPDRGDAVAAAAQAQGHRLDS